MPALIINMFELTQKRLFLAYFPSLDNPQTRSGMVSEPLLTFVSYFGGERNNWVEAGKSHFRISTFFIFSHRWASPDDVFKACNCLQHNIQGAMVILCGLPNFLTRQPTREEGSSWRTIQTKVAFLPLVPFCPCCPLRSLSHCNKEEALAKPVPSSHFHDGLEAGGCIQAYTHAYLL